jgi:glycine/D-amino acid oxidase-like deaminating enzyme
VRFLDDSASRCYDGTHKRKGFLNRTLDIARRYDIAHERLDAAAIAARFPMFNLVGDEEGYYEPGGGFVHPERCIVVQLRLAKMLGATLLMVFCGWQRLSVFAWSARIQLSAL